MPDWMNNAHMRRLPVYVLLDCSGSMAGAAIVACNEGLGIVYRELMGDPQCVETVWMSTIQFADQANQQQLVAIDQFVPPQLNANGSTAMGAAFVALAQSLEQDLVLNTATQHGDYRPLVFLLTDGRPTDDYRTGVDRIKQLHANKKPVIVALGCGPDVDAQMLHEVTENVFLMGQVQPEAIKAFFKWMSGSIAQTSSAVGSGAATQLPALNVPGIAYNPN